MQCQIELVLNKIKMKALQMNKHIFLWINQYPNDGFVGELLPVLITTTSLVIGVLGMIASAVYINHNLLEDLESSLYALFAFISMITVIYMWIVSFIIRRKLINVFNKTQEIHDTSTVSYYIDI